MTRKPQKRTQVTRSKILASAADLAAEHDRGLEGLTAEAISEHAGVAKGTIFAHFGDMDGLLSYLLLDRLRELRARADADDTPLAELSADPVATLLDRMMSLIEVITESQTMLRVFMDNIGVTKGHCAPEFVENLDALDRKLQDFLAYWQTAAEITPALRKDRDPAEMVDGLIAFMIHGAILYRSHQVDDLGEIRQRLTRHVEAFLLSPAP
ncbi:TetR/AcrR family transcriptional regulator [Roseibium polysiphoniae]|uniref:TetR/AcrR family transcriptional regulator n=1 Tax=Roseibium polysiphoniae TaxID=2571221 RepID=UPI002593E47F|nr:TetR/AcrR family transcriptional regulator [uncultured Roseibium sp.]